MDGYLLIDKPADMSSFGVVAQVRRAASQMSGTKIKVGHTGTLDPAATGLMVVVLGAYCKRASEFSRLDKTYQAQIKLGYVSSTGDSEGELVPQNGEQPTLAQVQAVLDSFIGEIDQIPPAHSAIKVGGQRAYKLARAGKAVQLKPRKVTIYSVQNVEYQYPCLSFTVRVGSGTYIRSLAADIGDKLGTGAYLAGLRRTRVGKFDIQRALSLSELPTKLKSSLQKHP